MTFASHFWMILGLLALPALAFLYYRSEKNKTRKLAHFAAAKLLLDLASSFSPVKRNIKATLSVAGIFLILAALARPQWGYVWQETKGKGIDILIALDTSKSMLAEDIRPNRLERAKLAILDLAERAEGDRLGLIAFSGNAFLQCPLTLDYDAFRQTLETVDTSIISRGGTNIAAAIAESQVSFADKDNFKILVLITDGEDLQEAGLEQARQAAEEGVKIYTVGVGSLAGELIPVRGENGSVDFLRDEEGNIVKTRLDERTLMAMAEATGAFYTRLGSTGRGLEQVYTEGLQSIPKEEREARLQQIPHERFQWPLGLAVLFLMAETFLGTRKRKVAYSPLPLRWTAGLVLAALTIVEIDLRASTGKGEKFYEEGEFDKAGQEYAKAAEDSPDDPRIQYNLGAALYRLGHFEDAEDTLRNALQTDDPILQKDTYYNLGNTLYRLGESTLPIDPAQTIEIWEEGLTEYENSLNIDPQDEDAQFNYELLKKRIKELKQQQQEQQQEQENQDQEQEENQDQDQKEQNSQEQEGDNQDQQGQQEQSKQGQKDEQENQQDGEGEDEQKEEQGQQQPSEGEGDDKKEAAEEQAQAVPGRMSREEARQLLEAMRNDEKKLPVIQFEKADGKEREAPIRDW